MKPTLIPDWRRALSFWSVRIAALGVVWGSLPVDTQTAMLAAVGVDPLRIPAILGALFIVFRLIAQPEPPEPGVEQQPWAGPPRD